MAVLYITELKELALSAGGHQLLAPAVPPVVEQKLTISGSSGQSGAFQSNTRYVMVHTDAICSLAFGLNPTAVNTAHRLAANETRFYGVNGGDKLAVIANT